MSVARRRGWGWLGWLLVAVAAVAVGGWWIAGPRVFGRSTSEAEKKSLKREPRVIAVTVEPVTPRPVRRVVSVVGSLYGREEVAVSPKVEGRIVKIRHDVGDRVRPGDVLLEIDPTDYRLAVEENRRALELELAKLGLKELPSGGLDVTSLPSVAKAAAQEKNAASRRDRMRRVGGGAASVEDRDQADTDYTVARANSQQAILDAEATLAAARHRLAALETARQRLRDTTVVVPSSEIRGATEFAVCGRSVSEGEIVRTMPFGDQQSMFRLVIDTPLKLKATVPDRHRGEIKVGQEAELEVEAYPGRKFAGKVSRVNPSVDRASRTFQAEVLVPNEERLLSAGSFAKVAVLTQVDTAAPTVPEEAVIDFAGVTKVFTVVDSRAREVKVRVGEAMRISNGGDVRTWVEVEGELPTGSLVVTSGQSKLADGTPVRVR